MITTETVAAKQACHDVILRFFRMLDERNYPALLECFNPEGVWNRQGEDLHGHAAMERMLLARSPTMRIHHFITNLQIDILDSTNAESFGYMTIFRHEDENSLQGPAPLKGPHAIFVSRAKLRSDRGRWTIDYITSGKPTFSAQ